MKWNNIGQLSRPRGRYTRASVIYIDNFIPDPTDTTTTVEGLKRNFVRRQTVDESSTPRFTNLTDVEERKDNPVLKWIT